MDVQSSPLTIRIPPAVLRSSKSELSTQPPTQASPSAGIIRIPAPKRKIPDMFINNGGEIYFQVRKRIQAEPDGIAAKHTSDAAGRPASKDAKPTVRFASP